MPASVDIVLEMHYFRPDDLDDRRRLLLGHSRIQETPRRLLIEWAPDCTDYAVLRETPDDDFLRGWSAIRRVLSEPSTAAEMLRSWPADSAPPSRATLHRWLAAAVDRRLLSYEASERKNQGYRYRLKEGEGDSATDPDMGS